MCIIYGAPFFGAKRHGKNNPAQDLAHPGAPHIDRASGVGSGRRRPYPTRFGRQAPPTAVIRWADGGWREAHRRDRVYRDRTRAGRGSEGVVWEADRLKNQDVYTETTPGMVVPSRDHQNAGYSMSMNSAFFKTLTLVS
jgi:hypothetical protein